MMDSLLDSSTTLQDLRQAYWDDKHSHPDWPDDIHFALFANESEATDEQFQSGICLNTERLCAHLLETASLFRLAKGAAVVDFACGKGDLLLRLVKSGMAARGTGIDIAPSAITCAIARAKAAKIDDRTTFLEGGLAILQSLPSGEADIVVCRDSYYLFSPEEQRQMLREFRRVLRPGGLLCISDLCVEQGHEEELRPTLLDRQYAGIPIRWRSTDKGVDYTLNDQAMESGLRPVGDPVMSMNAVALSYKLAADHVDNGRIRSAFLRLAATASSRSVGAAQTRVPYGVFSFVRTGDAPRPAPDSVYGIDIVKPFGFGRATLLRTGVAAVPVGQWSLIVGRSGVGKSTVLKLVTGHANVRGVQRFALRPKSIFFLEQHPTVISELSVEENVALFAESSGSLERTLVALGVDSQLRMRRADSKLSGGEYQRVALGQAIAANPSWLVLDEPCTAVDVVRRREFFSLLRSTLCDPVQDDPVTVTCVDHDFMSIEGYFDCVYELFHGELICLRHPNP